MTVELKLVPKPEGFELRDKRSDKTGRGSDWLPQDALYDASQQMDKENCIAVVIMWMEQKEDGSRRIYRRFAGAPEDKLRMLMNGVGIEMGWDQP